MTLRGNFSSCKKKNPKTKLFSNFLSIKKDFFLLWSFTVKAQHASAVPRGAAVVNPLQTVLIAHNQKYIQIPRPALTDTQLTFHHDKDASGQTVIFIITADTRCKTITLFPDKKKAKSLRIKGPKQRFSCYVIPFDD